MTNKNTAFDTTQYDAIYPNGIENHYWQRARIDILCDVLKCNKILNLKYLEIGCGKGIVVQSLRQKGLDVCGVELANISPLSTVQEYVLTGTSFIDLTEPSRNEYTGILLLDVIEHIENPSEFIMEIFNYYPNVKELVLTVPAKQALWSNYDEFNGHYKRYELSDLSILAKDTNSNIVDQGYFFHALYPVAKLLLKSKNNRSLEINAPTGFAKILHACIAQGFYWEYKILPSQISGSSLFFILQRNNMDGD